MQRSPLAQTLTLSIVSGITVFTLAKPLATADLACFMAMGREMLASGGLYETETLAFTELGRTFVNGTWLAQILFYLIHGLGGYGLLALTLAACVGGTLALVAHHGRLRGGSDAAGTAAAAVAAVLILQNLGIRPQTFSMPLFAAAFLIADRYRDRAFAPWALGGIFALWPNLHGAFPASLGILFTLAGAPILRDLRRGGIPAVIAPDAAGRRPLLLAGISLVATFLNPYGPRIYAYIASNSSMPRARMLDEWLPAEPLSFMGVRLGASIFLILALLLLRWRREGRSPLTLEGGIILAAFLWLALGSQRMILWWGLAAAPFVAEHLGALRAPAASSTPTLHRRLYQGAWVFWGGMLLLANPWTPRPDKNRVAAEGFPNLSQTDTPAQAVAMLEKMPGDRIFNKMMWGGYVLWRLAPRYSPFVDPRIWVYGDDTWAAYLELSDAPPDWEARMAGLGIGTLLLEPRTQGALIEAAKASPRWSLVMETAGQALFRVVAPETVPQPPASAEGP